MGHVPVAANANALLCTPLHAWPAPRTMQPTQLLHMPSLCLRFEIEYSANLNEALQALNITAPFAAGDLTQARAAPLPLLPLLSLLLLLRPLPLLPSLLPLPPPPPPLPPPPLLLLLPLPHPPPPPPPLLPLLLLLHASSLNSSLCALA